MIGSTISSAILLVCAKVRFSLARSRSGIFFRVLLLGWLIVANLGTAEADPISLPGLPIITNFSQMYNLPREIAAAGRSVRIKGVVLCFDMGWGQLYVHDGWQTIYIQPGVLGRDFVAGESIELLGSTTWNAGSALSTNLVANSLGRSELPVAKPLGLAEMAREIGEWVEITGVLRAVDNSLGRLALVIEDKGSACLIYVMGPPKEGVLEDRLGATVRIRGINASKVVDNQLQTACLFVSATNEVRFLGASNVVSSLPAVISIEALLEQKGGAWTNRPVHLNGLASNYKPGVSLELRDPTGKIHARVLQSTPLQPDDRVDLWGYLSRPGTAELTAAWFGVTRVGTGVPSPATGTGPISMNEARAALTNISDIRRLSKDKAKQHLPVRIRGAVTYADPEWRNAFVENQDGAIYIDLTDRRIHPGLWVEVVGETSPGGYAPEIVNSSFEILGPTNLPKPPRVDLEDLADGRMDARWIEMEGVVRRVNREADHATLTVTGHKGRFKVVVPNLAERPLPDRLVDALILIRGACSSQLNARRQLAGITLHSAGFDQISILEAVPDDPFSVENTPIAEVATFEPERIAGRRIKIHGTVTLNVPGDRFLVQDQSGGIQIRSSQTNGVRAGDVVDVLGFPALRDFSPELEEVTCRVVGLGSLPPPIATTAEKLLRFGTNDAVLVELEAHLLQDVGSAGRPRLVLQDGPIIFTASLTDARLPADLPRLRAGSILRVRGICSIQAGETHAPQSFRLLLRDPADVRLVKAPSRWTARHSLTLAGGTVFTCVLAFAWVASLRARVRAQTAIIHRKQIELMEISRKAGMAEVATSVLHNVGNVLNSVNVSATLVFDQLKDSKLSSLPRVASLLQEKKSGLGEFLTQDPKGRQVPAYLVQLAEHLDKERSGHLQELEVLRKNIDHIKEIVAMQQTYARVSGVAEHIPVAELVEDALRLSAEALKRHQVEVLRDYGSASAMISVEKHKALQILVNVISNAKAACDESREKVKQLKISVNQQGSRVRISFADNGVGIAEENLARIFGLGFTTRKDGHGFGLHSAALAARDLGGALLAHSDGLGKGATFTLELPIALGGSKLDPRSVPVVQTLDSV